MDVSVIRRRLAGLEVVLGVGVYDALSARLAARAGFPLLFLSGFWSGSLNRAHVGTP